MEGVEKRRGYVSISSPILSLLQRMQLGLVIRSRFFMLRLFLTWNVCKQIWMASTGTIKPEQHIKGILNSLEKKETT